MAKKDSKQSCVCKEKDTKIEELTTDLKRVQADFENYQKRVENEFISRDERGRAKIMLSSLVILDTINEGIKHEPKNDGLIKVKEVVVKFMHENNVQKMTKKAGDQFDHEEIDPPKTRAEVCR